MPADNQEASRNGSGLSSPQRIRRSADMQNGAVSFATTHWSVVLTAQANRQRRTTHLKNFALTWCKAQCQPVRRVKLLLVPRRTKCSSTCFRLAHPAWTHFTPRRSLPFLMGRTRPLESCGVNMSQTKSSPRGPTMVPMRSSRHPVEADLACGSRLLRHFFHICCRNGVSSCRLQ